jgi:signal transduction histidine kinase
MIAIKDSLQNPKQAQLFLTIAAEDEQRKQEMEAEKKAYQNRLQTMGLISIVVIFLVIAIGLWLNNKQKQKAFGILQQQKKETDIQKAKAEQALDELKATQSQLIQREKMASLGELTAGIAHEIQNPLNFVNNFSEINSELLDELKTELKADNITDANELAGRIAENEKKIIHHGRRADAIVKGMLQHSRNGAGVKEMTDINALADECMRLSYHGFLAREKEFNVSLVRNLDFQLDKIELVRADMSSVLLNIFNNAFYAVAKKMKASLATVDGNGHAREYLPEVGVETKLVSDGKRHEAIEIIIWDNGDGISTRILDKIFQPFFTTKAAGEGTGLGLSLSYDVIAAHGGQIRVKTEEGTGTSFIVTLQYHDKAG